jgi:hypothetical protein
VATKKPNTHENRGENCRHFNANIVIPGRPVGSQAGSAPRCPCSGLTAVEPFATGEAHVKHLDAEEGTRIPAAYSDNFGGTSP